VHKLGQFIKYNLFSHLSKRGKLKSGATFKPAQNGASFEKLAALAF